jgi:hypothetical protein
MRDHPVAVRLGAVLAAAIAMAAVLSSTASAADASLELALRYAPIVRLVEQKEPCGRGEAFVPTNVGRVLGSAGVVLRGPWDTTYLYFDRRVAKRYEQETAESGDVLPADVPPAALTPN